MGGPPPGSTPGKQQQGLRGIGETQELGAPLKGTWEPPPKSVGDPNNEGPP